MIFATLVVASAGSAAALVLGAVAYAGATTATISAVNTTVLVGASVTAATSIAITSAEVNEVFTGYNSLRDGVLVGDLGMSQSEAEHLYQNIKTGVAIAGGGVIAGGYYYNSMMAGNASTGGNSGTGINAGNLQYSDISRHLDRYYQNSTQLIQEIVDSQPPTVDPQGSAGLYWKVDGTFNATSGQYELLISPDGKTIWHFLFKKN